MNYQKMFKLIYKNIRLQNTNYTSVFDYVLELSKIFKNVKNIVYFSKSEENYIKSQILGKSEDDDLSNINRAYNNMEYLFVDKGNTYIFSHKIGDFSIKSLKNNYAKNIQKILIPAYILQKNDIPIKLGVICFQGPNLILDGENTKENIKTTMIVLSIIFSSISQMIYKRFDKLTSLLSRNEFDFELNNSLLKKPESLGLILVDIDHFKNINDTYGHDIGDLVLKQVAFRILAKIRSNNKLDNRAKDLAIRWGGEEFLILLFNTNLENTKNIAERIRERILQKEFYIDKTHTLKVTCSFGLTSIENKKLTKKLILENIKFADEALYKAKNSGRNKVEVFNK